MDINVYFWVTIKLYITIVDFVKIIIVADFIYVV